MQIVYILALELICRGLLLSNYTHTVNALNYQGFTRVLVLSL